MATAGMEAWNCSTRNVDKTVCSMAIAELSTEFKENMFDTAANNLIDKTKNLLGAGEKFPSPT